MTVPNAGPQQPDHHHADVDGMDARRGNPAVIYTDEPLTGGMEAASTRATTVSHRFGGVRHPLRRSDKYPPAERQSSPTERQPDDGGDPDASH